MVLCCFWPRWAEQVLLRLLLIWISMFTKCHECSLRKLIKNYIVLYKLSIQLMKVIGNLSLLKSKPEYIPIFFLLKWKKLLVAWQCKVKIMKQAKCILRSLIITPMTLEKNNWSIYKILSKGLVKAILRPQNKALTGLF